MKFLTNIITLKAVIQKRTSKRIIKIKKNQIKIPGPLDCRGPEYV